MWSDSKEPLSLLPIISKTTKTTQGNQGLTRNCSYFSHIKRLTKLKLKRLIEKKETFQNKLISAKMSPPNHPQNYFKFVNYQQNQLPPPLISFPYILQKKTLNVISVNSMIILLAYCDQIIWVQFINTKYKVETMVSCYQSVIVIKNMQPQSDHFERLAL